MQMVDRVVRGVRRLARRAGWDLVRYPGQSSREWFFRQLGIDAVFDVGANTGQYAGRLRAGGYRGAILSFEPLHEAFRVLEAQARRDPSWTCFNVALGQDDGDAVINKADFSVFSSFLSTTPFVEGLDSRSRATSQERVAVRRLDTCVDWDRLGTRATWLKVDTQGFELSVLRGASRSLGRFAGVELEMSLRPIYESQPGFEVVRSFMAENGFVLAALVPGFCDPRTGELVEVDGLFLPENPPPSP